MLPVFGVKDWTKRRQRKPRSASLVKVIMCNVFCNDLWRWYMSAFLRKKLDEHVAKAHPNSTFKVCKIIYFLITFFLVSALGMVYVLIHKIRVSRMVHLLWVKLPYDEGHGKELYPEGAAWLFLEQGQRGAACHLLGHQQICPGLLRPCLDPLP